MTGKATYLIYARSGKEIQVADDLRLLGIDVWCGLVLEGRPVRKRNGRDRRRIYEWTETTALPNYLWATLSHHEYQQIADTRERGGLKYLTGTMTLVPFSAERYLRTFQDRVDGEYRKALTAKERDEEPPPVFKPGEVLEMIGGPLAGLCERFSRIVEDAEGFHVVLDTKLGEVRVHPRDVRKAG